MKYKQLLLFRQQVYDLLNFAKDATFELTDAVLTTRSSYSLAEFSLSPFFRRKWPSIYEALQDCRPSRNKLMRLYIKQMPAQGRPILAVDHTVWTRLHSPTLQDRTYEHQPSAIASNKPISVGQGYSTIAWIPEQEGSWALPLRHERITSWENPIQKAAWQIKQVCKFLPQRPIVLLDSEYGNASLLNQTADVEADLLMRIRSNRCLYSAPSAYPGKGRPRKHGRKFKLNDPSTWWEADEVLEVDDSKLGHLLVRRWQNLHFSDSASHSMQLILVERIDSVAPGAKLKPLWLVWVGQSLPSLELIWRQYLRRFAVDHWYRLLKQRLHWTLPQLSTPQQCERWSDLMPILTWELWLARDLVAQHHLPWQKPLSNLTPGRVAQSISLLLPEIGTPAISPKPRGKSPGWESGNKRTTKPRYPVVKKGKIKHKKRGKTAA
jgi:hypothetical protein